MATRSFIILPNPKGDYTGIYCHWDGYPSHVGRVLKDHYRTPREARGLISLGDLSSLGERLTPLDPETHSYDFAEKGTTVAYWRDRYHRREVYKGQPSWSDLKPRTRATLADLIECARDAWCEYVYIYFNGLWHFIETPGEGELTPPFTLLTDESIAAYQDGVGA